jgi:hypothetical protein
MDQKMTEDAKHFGENVFVYCSQHLRPHSTGWCTVSVSNKIKLDATDEVAAYAECEAKGYKIYKG